MRVSARTGPPALCAICAVGAAIIFADLVRLPMIFPGSDALLLAGLTLALAFGLGLMLPDRIVFTEAELLRETLRLRGAGSAENAERVIVRIVRARAYARRMRDADNGFRADLRALVEEVASDLDQIAARILERPRETSDTTALLARAGLAVEAVERHSEIRRDSTNGNEDLVQETRDRVIATLRHLADVMDATMRQRVMQKVTDLGVTTGVADDLYESMKGNDR